ncbi:hypothetical protein BDB01DRAFT_731425 [Pilobolus umbonatus]|nr:hypothetical protein BDB01DRAFT_731425 [Pilobolus umbonatus]
MTDTESTVKKKKKKRKGVTVYTEEADDLMDEMPRGDRELLLRSKQRRKKKATEVQAWSRRESLSQKNRHPGLSSGEAVSKLLVLAHSILDEERTRISKTAGNRENSKQKQDLINITSLDFRSFRITGLLVEALLLLLVIIWNIYIYYREHVLTYREMTDRAEAILDALERNGMNMVQDTKIPFIPSMSVAKVVRDGVVRIFPVNLLVQGDIVEMLYGDIAPGRMKYLNHMNEKEYYLAKDQTFKPSFFGIPPPTGLMEEYMRSRGRHQFQLLETPLESNMRRALNQKRPNTVMYNEGQVLIRVFYRYIIWIVLVLSLIINGLRCGLRSVMVNAYPVDQIAEELITLSVYVILPLLPLCIPTMWIIARSFGNAQLLILFEALQISKTEYEDDDEVDEFDAEAPPPIKDLELSPNAVWDRFLSLLTMWDKLSLTRSTNLLESLGSTTVICCLDREGTIANPFPTVEQLMFPNSEEDIIYLDVEEDSDTPNGIKFEDQDWEHYLSCLKPLGLNFMLNTNCGVIQGHKRAEYHRRRSKLHVYGKTSCLCRLGKCIGFREKTLQSFSLRAEIYTFAPYHEILNSPRFKYSKYYPFEIPNALSTVFEETNTDGHPSLVMDKCSDYWDGQSLQTMSEQMEKKINDFYQNALVHDMQCIAYAYRPIATTNGKIKFLHENEDEDPGCAFVVLPYKVPSDESENSSTSSDYSFEEDEPLDEQEETSFFKEVVKGQIFLGMAAMCHQPKQNVVDFIEDLGLAGIRFVYFSPTAERESKAFAERLGLETDWNSCILLSNPDDEHCGNGYLQKHDIKAQLPRGIDEIRPHLEDVDDIPLHVSLFAECTPRAMKEMIRIFQENGEVVCSIGNALNTKNTDSFALVSSVNIKIGVVLLILFLIVGCEYCDGTYAYKSTE